MNNDVTSHLSDHLSLWIKKHIELSFFLEDGKQTHKLIGN